MLNEVFDYSDYREYVRNYFKSLPKEGFGQLSKAAKALDIQPSLFTGVLQGTKNLTPEQALDFAYHIQMSELETEFFTALVQLERAGTERLRSRLREKLKDLKNKSSLIKNRIPHQSELPEQVKAQFYSQWYYSAIRMASSIPDLNTPEQIAANLGLSRQTILRTLEFLIQHNLVVFENGAYNMGPQRTHIGAGEALASRHHTNWRLKAIEELNQNPGANLHFTSPLSISAGDAEIVRKIVTKAIEQAFEVVDPSPAEEVYCLLLDWFKVSR